MLLTNVRISASCTIKMALRVKSGQTVYHWFLVSQLSCQPRPYLKLCCFEVPPESAVS